jgi:cytochrome P450
MTFPPDLLSDEFFQNPYPVYEELRSQDPVHWSEQLGAWIVTRYADVQEMFRDSENFSNAGRQLERLERLPAAAQAKLEPLLQFYHCGGLINADPPDHTRLRRLLQRAFTPRSLENMRPRMQEVMEDLLSPHLKAGHLEVIADVSGPLPSLTIAEMLGASEKDRPLFGKWADMIIHFLTVPELDVETALEAQSAILQMREYFRGLMQQRKADGRQDLLTTMAEADEEGDRFTEQELLATCQNLLLAGQNTTMYLIANAVAALLQHPDQLQKLLKDRSLLEGAIEETLRFEGSAHTIRRVVKRTLEWRGKLMKQGQPVIIVVGSANHDPEQFSRPDDFDIARDFKRERHIAYGSGIHFCIGAALARMESYVALDTILRLLPNLRLGEKAVLRRRHVHTERAWEALPIRFDALAPNNASDHFSTDIGPSNPSALG